MIIWVLGAPVGIIVSSKVVPLITSHFLFLIPIDAVVVLSSFDSHWRSNSQCLSSHACSLNFLNSRPPEPSTLLAFGREMLTGDSMASPSPRAPRMHANGEHNSFPPDSAQPVKQHEGVFITLNSTTLVDGGKDRVDENSLNPAHNLSESKFDLQCLLITDWQIF